MQEREQSDGRRGDGQHDVNDVGHRERGVGQGVEHGNVVGSVVAVEDGVGYGAGAQGDEHDRDQETDDGEETDVDADGGVGALGQPDEILGDEHGHERIAGQQVDATLALGDAVEEEHEQEGEPREDLQGVGLAGTGHEGAA